jgi:tRNA threonylcarbamoyladenosine biosynthesis protein TsaE
MNSPTFTCLLPDAAATDALGASLAATYEPADGGAVVHLEGELGAGKTTCVRSVLRAFGVTGTIRSPTYTLVETYESAVRRCVHVDLYRLASPAEVEPLGLRDHLDGTTLMLVEWPGQGGEAVPAPDMKLSLDYAGDARTVSIQAFTLRGRRWVELLLKHASFQGYLSNLT